MKHRVRARPGLERRLRAGLWRLSEDALEIPAGTRLCEGDLLEIRGREGFLALGYYGRENRGTGWVLDTRVRERVDEGFFRERFQAAARKRTTLLADPRTDCCRLVHGEGDRLGGLCVDRYGEYALLHWFNQGVYHFRPSVLAALPALFPFRGVYEKRRFGPGGGYLPGPDHVAGGRHPDRFTVRENGLCFRVDLGAGAMTGLFPDMRHPRKLLRDRWAGGRRVLNLFAYTGSFSVAARAGGATRVVSVDLARRTRQAHRDNLEANGMDPDAVEVVTGDVFAYLRTAGRRKELFDLVILDPPSFSRAGRSVFRVGKDYGRLLAGVLEILAPGGLLLVATNAASLSRASLEQMLAGALEEAGRPGTIRDRFGLPADFPVPPGDPEGAYLKVLLAEVP